MVLANNGCLLFLSIVYNDTHQKVLIIAPTRELAIQIDTEFRLFAANMQIFSAVCVGDILWVGKYSVLNVTQALLSVPRDV